MEGLQAVMFKLGGQVFCADAAQIIHIEKYHNTEKTSGLPDFVEGIMDNRGTPVPVINLAAYLGIDGLTAKEKSKVLIVNLKDMMTGFQVDDVSEIVTIAGSDIEPLPGMLREMTFECLQRAAKKDGSVIPVIDFLKLLSTQEFNLIREKTEQPIR